MLNRIGKAVREFVARQDREVDELIAEHLRQELHQARPAGSAEPDFYVATKREVSPLPCVTPKQL